jgi:hypothetical protein
MTDYKRTPDGRIRLLDINIAFYHAVIPNTICKYKKNKPEKYKELKREFREARDKGVVK